MNENELSLIKDQMNNLFSAYEQMSNIYKGSILKLFSRILDKDVSFEETDRIFINVNGKNFLINSVYVENNSVFARGSWKCCPSTSCTISNENLENICLENLCMEELIKLSKLILSLL